MFARHFGMPPEKIGPEETRSFQVLPDDGKEIGARYDCHQ
jgi:hypothetical protein